MPDTTADPRPLAWNGARILAPRDWEPHRLERCYLRASDGRGLALECKWQEGRSVTAKTALKRLGQALKGATLRTAEGELPPELRKACRRLEERAFSAHPFAWELPEQRGWGAWLQCGVCGRGTLLQCVDASRGPEALPLAAHLLESFTDHAPDLGREFALFGIRTVIPAGFTLAGFSFTPGSYRLAFRGSGRGGRPSGATLVLERLGPATVLLQGRAFHAWAAERFAQAGGKGTPEPGTWQGGPALLWQPPPTGGGLLGFLRARRLHSRVRAWLPEGHNAVLCAALTDKGAHGAQRFEEVCRDYVPT